MAKRTGPGSGKAPPAEILKGEDLISPEDIEAFGPLKTSIGSKDRGQMRNAERAQYCKSTVERMLFMISSGLSLQKACHFEGNPCIQTWYMWLARYPDLQERYLNAIRLRGFKLYEEILQIADNGQNDWMERLAYNGANPGWEVNGEHIARSRLRVDTRRWLLGKFLNMFGDKQQIEVSGKLEMGLAEAIRTKRLARLQDGSDSDQAGN